MKTFRTICFLSMLLPGLNGYSQIDSILPQLVSFNISPQSVNITFDSAVITITCVVTDNISGVGTVTPSIILPSGYTASGGANLIAGDSSNGTWAKTFVIPEATLPGTGMVFNLFLSDRNFNQINIPFTELQSLGFDADFEIINDNPEDSSPPQLASLTITPQLVDITSQSATISVDMHVTDDISGTFVVTPTMKLPSGYQASGGGWIINGTTLNGTWRKTFTIPEATEPGLGAIISVFLQDENGNNTSLDSNELIALGCDIYFEIINSNEVDTTPPLLVSFYVTPQIVYLVGDAVPLDITVEVTDDISGVTTVTPLMFLPNGTPHSGGGNIIEGNSLDGTWVKTFSIPFGTEPGIGHIATLYLGDQNGNSIIHTFDDLFGFGWDPDYLVVYDELPVGLIHFEAVKHESEVILSWSTASEYTNAGFEIELSNDNHHWTKIGFVEGAGFSNIIQHYKFIDTQPFTGSNYYRLKQMDFDGHFSYSRIASLNVKGGEIEIYPNPTTGIFEFKNADAALVQILNNDGKVVEYERLNSEKIDLTSQPPGLYSILIPSNGQLIVKRLLKW